MEICFQGSPQSSAIQIWGSFTRFCDVTLTSIYLRRSLTIWRYGGRAKARRRHSETRISVVFARYSQRLCGCITPPEQQILSANWRDDDGGRQAVHDGRERARGPAAGLRRPPAGRPHRRLGAWSRRLEDSSLAPCRRQRRRPVRSMKSNVELSVFTVRCYASAVLAMARCPSVRQSVSPSVTSRCSTKTAKRRITQTTPYNSPGTLVFWRQRSPRNSTGVLPYGGRTKCRWGRSKSATFDK